MLSWRIGLWLVLLIDFDFAFNIVCNLMINSEGLFLVFNWLWKAEGTESAEFVSTSQV